MLQRGVACRKEETDKKLEAIQGDVLQADSRSKSQLAAARSEAADARLQHASLLRSYESLQAAYSAAEDQAERVRSVHVCAVHVCASPHNSDEA